MSDVRRMTVNTLGPELFSTADFATLDDLVVKLRADNGAGVRAA